MSYIVLGGINMISDEEYIELINALIEDGFSFETAKKIIDKSELEGLLEPPFYNIN